MSTKITISKEIFQSLLKQDPDTSLCRIAVVLGCNVKTVTREMKRHGVRTKTWSERKHSAGTKAKISAAQTRAGHWAGKNNPSCGTNRKWLESEANPLRKWHKENPDFGENQRGENNPIHKVSHLYEDPDYVHRITRGIRAHVDEKRGSTYEETYGKEKAAEYKERLRLASPARMAKFARKETSPERQVREILECLGVPFEQEAPMVYYTVDFLLPAHKIIIQADGDYWHGHPVHFPDPTPAQRNTRRKDAACDSFIKNRGFEVIRAWESDLARAGYRQELKQTIMEMVNG